MCDGCGELQAVQEVVAVVVVHLEVVQLELLGRHLFLWFVNHSLQVLHDVAAARTGTTTSTERSEVAPPPGRGPGVQTAGLTLCPGPWFCPGGRGCGLRCAGPAGSDPPGSEHTGSKRREARGGEQPTELLPLLLLLTSCCCSL